MAGGYWVYILASKRNGTLYIGMTENLGRRIWQHRQGTAESFTRRHCVKLLVHTERFEHLDDARVRERQLKRWRRQWKLELIETDNPEWQDLAERLNV
ncbi:GIY-YIG nuclease family protein [Microbaculum marinum]|uniref:GIY-YIG nuclease family protein n=1 Tax=Microbaculum marinum TaxID=1764581 RepID=A0AAW9RMJ1_9HYPH